MCRTVIGCSLWWPGKQPHRTRTPGAPLRSHDHLCDRRALQPRCAGSSLRQAVAQQRPRRRRGALNLAPSVSRTTLSSSPDSGCVGMRDVHVAVHVHAHAHATANGLTSRSECDAGTTCWCASGTVAPYSTIAKFTMRTSVLRCTWQCRLNTRPIAAHPSFTARVRHY